MHEDEHHCTHIQTRNDTKKKGKKKENCHRQCKSVTTRMQKNKGKTRNVSGIKKKLTTRRKKIIKTMAMKHNSKSRRRSEKKN